MQNEPPVPNTWEELVALRSYLDSCPGSYLRHPEDKYFYDSYRELTPKEIFLTIIRRQIEPERTKILKNRFPYTRVLQNLSDVAQYVLWSLDGSLSEETITNEANKKFRGFEWFAVESAPHRKSVPEIWHTHIFVKGLSQYSP